MNVDRGQAEVKMFLAERALLCLHAVHELHPRDQIFINEYR
jgi:hypothetical protein